ncbi:ester cyclase [Cognatishimia activa]|uniref:Putative ester cyclase n=1 Tax=Cognatishimia activa TaxID=1715691 RepID=A0A0N7MC53_9RHOB|nr:ester cyclase [Cognatishimia activa]CUJ29118.1 putative ester cyclase [Cognatishimia activa]CUK27248.1 putative ester cyclase [Cognatishimia activa]
MSEKVKLLEQWFQRVWNEADLDAIDDYFSQDTKAGGLMPDMRLGPQDFKDFVPLILALLDDLHIELLNNTENEDWLQSLYKVTALSAATSAPIQVLGQVTVRVENGKIIEAYNCFDFMGFFEQLGQLPEQSIAICLTGGNLR